METKAFHHGNLRTALIDLATSELAGKTHQDISLRDLAARIGVSYGAPYRHFATKEDLLEAVAQKGLRAIVVRYEEASRMQAPPVERLAAAAKAYLDLASSNPGLFNLLFFTKAYVGENANNARPGSAFTVFERMVADAYGVSNPDDVRLKALAAWSLLHGFAVLRAQGRIAPFASTEAAEDVVIGMVCRSCLCS